MRLSWLGSHATNQSTWFDGLRFRRIDNSTPCDVYRKQQIPACAVLVSYAPFVYEHGRLRRAYHRFLRGHHCCQVCVQKTPDSALRSAECVGFYPALSRPQQNCANLYVEVLCRLCCGQPCWEFRVEATLGDRFRGRIFGIRGLGWGTHVDSDGLKAGIQPIFRSSSFASILAGWTGTAKVSQGRPEEAAPAGLPLDGFFADPVAFMWKRKKTLNARDVVRVLHCAASSFDVDLL
jgi:hypothetical protein